MRAIPFIVAAIGAFLAGYVAVHTTEVQPAVLVIALICMALGFASPKLAWLWALTVGGGVFLGYLVCEVAGIPIASPPQPSIYGSLVALIPAFITAYIGASARWLAGPGAANAKS